MYWIGIVMPIGIALLLMPTSTASTRRGRCLIDALLPAIDALREGGELGEALNRSADAAEEGMKATIPLEARKGRASYLGPRSVGHQDPGATSSYLLLRAAAETLS
jgi:dihydroxyacetone kinase-like protein